VSNQYCLSCSSEQRTFIPSTANTVIIDLPGSLLETSSPGLNVSIVAIVFTPSMSGTLRYWHSARLLDGYENHASNAETLIGPIALEPPEDFLEVAYLCLTPCHFGSPFCGPASVCTATAKRAGNKLGKGSVKALDG
jgi:hypothetical protein